jgi:hypothetical protein
MLLWANVGNLDTIVAAEYPDLSDKTVHVYGTFGGATVTIEGSNNGGASFTGLNDPSSTAISITAEKMKQILENPQQIRPTFTGGGGTQSLSVAMLIKQNNPLRT